MSAEQKNENFSVSAAVARLREQFRFLTSIDAAARDLDLVLSAVERWQAHRRPVCVECGKDSHAFMVDDIVWAEVGFNRKDHACLPCVEKRLGRSLILSDFQVDLPINREIVWAFSAGYYAGRQSRR